VGFPRQKSGAALGPHRQKIDKTQAFSRKKAIQGWISGRRLLTFVVHFNAKILKGVFFWQKN